MEKACSLLNRHLQDVIEEWLWHTLSEYFSGST